MSNKRKREYWRTMNIPQPVEAALRLLADLNGDADRAPWHTVLRLVRERLSVVSPEMRCELDQHLQESPYMSRRLRRTVVGPSAYGQNLRTVRQAQDDGATLEVGTETQVRRVPELAPNE